MLGKRSYIKVEYPVYLTVSLETIVVTSSIESHGGREVATIDIPGAYLHTYSYEEVIMVMKVRLAEVLMNIHSNLYSKYVVLEKV